jgi:hypothetical protein
MRTMPKSHATGDLASALARCAVLSLVDAAQTPCGEYQQFPKSCLIKFTHWYAVSQRCCLFKRGGEWGPGSEIYLVFEGRYCAKLIPNN